MIRKSKNNNSYTYWKGIVLSVNDSGWGGISIRFKFRVLGEENEIGGHYYTLLGGIGFNQNNMPKIGDKVLLRYKNGFGYTCNVSHSKIV